MAKYKIVISEGCTAFYTEVNGKIVGGEYEPSRLSETETSELIDYLCDKLRAGVHTGEICLDSLIQVFEADDYEYDDDDDACETCGDTVSRTTYEI